MKSLRCIFFGTPDFAAASLQALIDSEHKVLAVVTAPDKPGGRGMNLRQSSVKKCAIQHKINVLQPTNLKNIEFQEELAQLSADIFIVVAFRMLPKAVWILPRLNTFNLHASLLPDYRGAAPINHAIINGEKKSGVTTFFINEKIDEGEMLLQEDCLIDDEMNASQLHNKLMIIGSNLVVKTCDLLAKGNIKPIKQKLEATKLAPKIFKQDCKINWKKDVDSVYNFIRGLSEYPAAFTTLESKTLKIYRSAITHLGEEGPPGSLIIENKKLIVRCANGCLEILELQLEGRKRMKAEAFLAGYAGELRSFEL